MTDLRTLDQALLGEHARGGDPLRLAELYRQAGSTREADGDIDAACFFYTHGFVYALEAGDDGLSAALRDILVRHDREPPERGKTG